MHTYVRGVHAVHVIGQGKKTSVFRLPRASSHTRPGGFLKMPQRPRVLIVGGTHGNERAGIH